MHQNRILKYIFVICLITAVVLPLFSILYIYPSFTELLVKNTEREALRVGEHLSNLLIGKNSNLSSISVSDKSAAYIGRLKKEFNLMKIKIFTPSGEIIFSTTKKDIGEINNKSYFREVVARGNPYTKVVRKDTLSLEGQTVSADVVETYVPVMKDGVFAGAFEIYYDITARNKELHSILLFSSVAPVLLMFFFLTSIVTLIMKKHAKSYTAHLLGNSRRYRTPYFSLVMITISLFLAEILVMTFVHYLPSMSKPWEALLDALLLIMLTAPTIYFFVVEPLMRYIETHMRDEEAIRANQMMLMVDHERLQKVFKQVEIAKKEWEITMDCAGDFIILTDNQGKIKRVNKAVRDFVDESYEALIGKNWEMLIQEHGFEAVSREVDIVELYHGPSDKWFEFRAYPVEDAALDLSGSVIIIHEATERKKIMEELRKTNKEINLNRRKLQMALNHISGLILNATNKVGTTSEISNPHLQKCYEIKKCDMKECACYGMDAVRCWQIAGTFCGGEAQGKFAQKFSTCSQCEVFQRAMSDPIYEISEQFLNMMHILEMKNRELQNAYEELKNTHAQMLQQEKMASIGQLAAGVAHEINNPMGFISSNLGTLQKYVNKIVEFAEIQKEAMEELNSPETAARISDAEKKLKINYITEDIHQLIDESLEGADRVKKIVQNLKSFSRIDEAEYKLADINDCIENTLNIVWNELKYKTTVHKDYGELPMTKCYPHQLNQVFMNLLVNASQAIEEQGEIVIKTWNQDGTINVAISDTGKGIPADAIDRIFEPFYTTKEVGKGTGLGLSITYDIVKKHNGQITVVSKEGKGTEFTIEIPVTVEDRTAVTPGADVS